MAEQSVNVTVEQATIQHNKSLATLSNVSSIEYEEAYSFLSESSFSGEHIQISNVSLDPPNNQYQIRFYELKNPGQNRRQPQSITLESSSIESQVGRHKIMSLNIKQENKYDKVVRLPRTNKTIQLEVQSRDQGILRGKILEDQTQIESSLYNQKGEKVATLQYDLKIANSKNNQSKFQQIDYNQDLTLHSKDFQVNQSPQNSRLKESDNDQKLQKVVQEQPQNKLEKIEEEDEQKAQKITTTMSASSKVVRVIRRRKKYQNFGEDDLSEVQQKGSQNYEANIIQKVGSYQNPFAKKDKIMAPKQTQIDFMSLNRSKQELGLSALNFQKIIYPKYVQSKFNTVIQQPKILQDKEKPQNIPEKVQNPEVRVINEPASTSNRVSYQDYGVGTYTPISSAKSSIKLFNSGRQNTNVKSNSAKTNLQKLNKLKVQNKPKRHRKKQECQLKQSQVQQIYKKRGYSQRKSFLTKFFLTGRQEQAKKMELRQMGQQKSKTDHKKKQKHLSVDNKVLEIKVQESVTHKHQLNIAPVVLQKEALKENKLSSKESKAYSLKETPIMKNQSNFTSLSDSGLYPQYNLIISNISLNFRKKTFGSKYLVLKLNGARHSTQKLNGNNLMWAGKSFKFQRISHNQELTIQVRGESLEQEFSYGKVKVGFNELLINKRQSYFQTFLLGEKQVLGVLIIGYEIAKKRESIKSFMYPEKDQRKSYVHSEIKRMKETESKEEFKSKKKQYVSGDLLKIKLPSPKANAIKMKKYLGGINIKIGRAHRFQDQGKLFKPGPGDYEIQSAFSRHAFKED